MTKTAAVMIAPGCEEVEALSSVDVLRRAGIKCDMVGLFDKIVNGDHNIVLSILSPSLVCKISFETALKNLHRRALTVPLLPF